MLIQVQWWQKQIVTRQNLDYSVAAGQRTEKRNIIRDSKAYARGNVL